jgi:hypothetical protein
LKLIQTLNYGQSDPAQNVAATWQPVNIKATHDEDADRNGAQSHK